MDSRPQCKTCSFFYPGVEPEYGTCDYPHFLFSGLRGEECINISCDVVEIEVGYNFGCIHHCGGKTLRRTSVPWSASLALGWKDFLSSEEYNIKWEEFMESVIVDFFSDYPDHSVHVLRQMMNNQPRGARIPTAMRTVREYFVKE